VAASAGIFDAVGFQRTDIAGVMAETAARRNCLPVLVPQVDADGNHTDGCATLWSRFRLHLSGLERAQGRLSAKGIPATCSGAFIPFFALKLSAWLAGDPRPSLEERYPTHESYVEEG